jgi:glutathione synthase/RimK-type ligase-like ATP-grasp enzyme
LPNAPLYTKYVKKRDEYRVFVVGGEAVRVTQKRGRTGTESDFRIRSANNGWVFCQENVDCPPAVRLAGVQAVQVLGLDFGAADVGFNEHYDMPCVYEVNTAFGMEGTTLQVVSDAIKEMYR